MKRECLSVLIVRLSALGDVAMVIPAVYSVAQAYPQHRFFVLTTSFCARLFVTPPENIVLLPVETKDVHGMGGTIRLIRTLRASHFSSVADLHNVLRSWMIDLCLFVGGAHVAMLDKKRWERLRIIKHKLAESRPYILRYTDVFSRLGFPAELNFKSLYSKGLPLLPKGIPVKGSKYWVGVAPFARYVNKTYPNNLMQEVIRQLSERPKTAVFLFGSRGKEKNTLVDWASAARNVTVVAGRFTLEEELALMAYLDVMVSMDSANMHMASLVGVRVVSVWGSTTPACGFLGWGQHEADALCMNLSCQPCTISGSNYCNKGSFECLRGLSPSTIVNKL